MAYSSELMDTNEPVFIMSLDQIWSGLSMAFCMKMAEFPKKNSGGGGGVDTITGMTLGEIVIGQRTARDWSRAELAERAGLSEPTLKKIEIGAVERPSWWHIVAIATALGVSLDTFRGATAPGADGRGGDRS